MSIHGLVPAILPVHILAGGLALVFGYAALYATKGATLHRKSGLLFVYAMVAMALSGALMDVLTRSRMSVNTVAGLLTFYFVTTSLATVRRRAEASAWIDRAGLLFALSVSVLAFTSGFELASRGRPEAAPSFIFGLVGLLAAAGDIRMIRRPIDFAPGRPRRLARHLWRMCFAMWVAAASFFWGPPGRVPELIYYPALLPIPVLLPIAVMVYWLRRLRVRKNSRGSVGVTASRITALTAPAGASHRA